MYTVAEVGEKRPHITLYEPRSSGGASEASPKADLRYFPSRIDGVKVTPVSKPSGDMKRLTV
jgi:hypothetical protein